MQSRTMSHAAARAEKFAADCEKSGQRAFTLHQTTDNAGQPLRFITFGCQGSGKKEQREVALQLNELCANPATRPAFILVLGDNIYPWGASYADDHAFIKYFRQMYLDLPHLKNIPFFLLPGNHDLMLGGTAMTVIGSITEETNEKGIPRIMHQVAHTFIADDKFTAESKEKIYTQAVLDLDNLPAWNMPRRYYTLITGDVQIFCVDSNSYVNEFLKLETLRLKLSPDVDISVWLKEQASVNQAAWLLVEYTEAKRAGRKMILAQHHPLYTAGKRAYERDFHNDLGIYLNEREIHAARILLGFHDACSETPFNLCLTECYRRQNMVFGLTLTAHDHCIYNYSNKGIGAVNYEICQLVVGSGGGDLQDRNKFDEQQSMGCFIKQTGVAIVSHHAGDEHFTYSVHTSDRKHHLVFNTHQPAAIVAWEEDNAEQDEIHAFFAVVETALNQYFAFLGNRQNEYNGGFFSLTNNTTHGNKGAERAHQLWAYIRQHRPPSMITASAVIHNMTKRGTFERSASDNSLITYLDKAMQAKYKLSMEQFATKVSKRPIKLLGM